MALFRNQIILLLLSWHIAAMSHIVEIFLRLLILHVLVLKIERCNRSCICHWTLTCFTLQLLLVESINCWLLWDALFLFLLHFCGSLEHSYYLLIIICQTVWANMKKTLVKSIVRALWATSLQSLLMLFICLEFLSMVVIWIYKIASQFSRLLKTAREMLLVVCLRGSRFTSHTKFAF